jgi:ParB-like chromosome segregation protein Spo0J
MTPGRVAMSDAADLHADVDLVATADLIPYSNNPKEHPDEQVKKIASSIKNYGWDQPIVVDGDGEIIKGHGRLQAAEVLGLDEVPVIRRDDLSYAEARASRLADNKTAESPWDDELLAVEVDVLDDTDSVDMDTLGFDEDELDSLIDEASLGDEDIEEAFNELPEGERDEIRQRTFTLSEDQLERVEDALDKAKGMGEFPPGPNDNENGNAIARVCTKFLEGC